MARIANGGDVIGQEILMFHRGDWVVHIHHGPNLINTVTTRIDDDVAINIALICVDGPRIVFVLSEGGHGRVAIDFGTCKPRPPR